MTQPNENSEMTSFAEALESSLQFKNPSQGDLLEGTIISISGDVAYVAFGGPTEAVIDVDELEGNYEIGDTVEASVVSSSPEGIRISRKLLAKRASIQALQEALSEGLAVEGTIVGRNKGGYDVKMGSVRVFCPLSQIDLGRIEEPDSHVGETYDFKVLEASDDGRKLVVSRAALLKEEAAARGRETLENLQVGMTVNGTVRNVVPFGAFIDIGGIEGLLHVSEISHQRIEDPKTVLKPGEKLDVVVTRIEQEGKRISLSRKDLEPDPWDTIHERYEAGQKFSGEIARKTDFGLFVELEQGIDGLIHQSMLPHTDELSDPKYGTGQPVEGWIKDVDGDRRRISLSLREVASENPWETVLTKYPTGRVLEGTVERPVDFGVFVELEPGLTGLLPVSELELGPDQAPDSIYEPGQTVTVRVMTIDPERERLSLTTSSHEEVDAAKNAADESAPGKSAMALAIERALN